MKLVIESNGIKEKCDILFFHEDEEYQKKYVFYIIKKTKEVEVMNYTDEGTFSNLFPITNVKEQLMLDEVLEDYLSDFSKWLW